MIRIKTVAEVLMLYQATVLYEHGWEMVFEDGQLAKYRNEE